jgi:hypothetical protein
MFCLFGQVLTGVGATPMIDLVARSWQGCARTSKGCPFANVATSLTKLSIGRFVDLGKIMRERDSDVRTRSARRWHGVCSPKSDMDAPTTNVTSPVSILVIEHASYSLPWLERAGSGHVSSSAGQMSSDVVVVSQLASEPSAAFATRVLRRIARLSPSTTIHQAVLACGPRLDEASLAARARIAQALLSAAQASPSAKLTLAAGASAVDGLRHQLLAIAGTLLEQARAPGVNISVQLGEGTTRKNALTEAAEISRKVA